MATLITTLVLGVSGNQGPLKCVGRTTSVEHGMCLQDQVNVCLCLCGYTTKCGPHGCLCIVEKERAFMFFIYYYF